jgi:hypothetical protein
MLRSLPLRSLTHLVAVVLAFAGGTGPALSRPSHALS